MSCHLLTAGRLLAAGWSCLLLTVSLFVYCQLNCLQLTVMLSRGLIKLQNSKFTNLTIHNQMVYDLLSTKFSYFTSIPGLNCVFVHVGLIIKGNLWDIWTMYSLTLYNFFNNSFYCIPLQGIYLIWWIYYTLMLTSY